MKTIKDSTLSIIFIAFVILLIGFGIGFLYTASQPESQRLYGSGNIIVLKQILYLALGIVGGVIAFLIPLRFYRKHSMIITFSVIGLLIVTLLPGVSSQIMGARRWIMIGGFSIQPSEIAKFALILYLASVLTHHEENLDDFYLGVFPSLIIAGVMVGLVFLGNDFSTAIIMIIITFIVYYFAGVRMLTLVMMGSISVVLSSLMLVFAPYRIKRLFAFLNPWNDPLGSGWQTIQAFKCFSVGGYTGVGLGESVQKYSALPEAHNDYIFGIIIEEAGVFTGIFLIVAYLIVAIVGLNIAKSIQKKEAFIICTGITSLIFVQAMINIAVVAGLLPPTG